MNTASRLLLPAALNCVLTLVLAPHALPQERGAKANAFGKASPTAAAPAALPARVRFWKTEHPSGGDGDMVLLWRVLGNETGRPRPGKEREVARAAAGYQFGQYSEVAADDGSLLVRQADGKEVATVLARLTPGSFHTLLLSEHGLELIPDAPVTGTDTGDFTLRNLTPGVRTLSVKVGEEVSARFDQPGGVLRMRGLRAGVYSIRTEGTDAEGKPFNWTAEADFTRASRQTLLVYPDAYGRIRPRLVVDGESGDSGEKADRP